MKTITCFFIALVTATLFSSCEKVIPVDLDEGTSQLTVDAFIDDAPGSQKIRLTKTGAYFANVSNIAATGATVYITDDDGHRYTFVDNANSGDYIWTPLPGDTLVRLFHSYTLSILYGGEQFAATAVAFPVPPIDSVTFEAKKNAVGEASATAYIAQFYAMDIVGMTNFYWIKSYKNGVLYSKPGQINLSQDGAFAGGGTDGLAFIFPIRTAIIPGTDSLNRNDSLTVKVFSINEDTYNYLNQVVQQTTNGGLFATPPFNVFTNVKNINSDSKTKPVGWFNIGTVSTSGVRVK
jgi:hypothetical protein